MPPILPWNISVLDTMGFRVLLLPYPFNPRRLFRHQSVKWRVSESWNYGELEWMKRASLMALKAWSHEDSQKSRSCGPDVKSLSTDWSLLQNPVWSSHNNRLRNQQNYFLFQWCRYLASLTTILKLLTIIVYFWNFQFPPPPKKQLLWCPSTIKTAETSLFNKPWPVLNSPLL